MSKLLSANVCCSCLIADDALYLKSKSQVTRVKIILSSKFTADSEALFRKIRQICRTFIDPDSAMLLLRCEPEAKNKSMEILSSKVVYMPNCMYSK